MKKLTLNLDAVFVITLLLFASVSLNFYQRYQYSDLLLEYTTLQVDKLKNELSVSFNRAALEQCLQSKAGD